MQYSPEDSELYNNFKPSKFSGQGFLGNDDRTLQEIISADKRILEGLNVTCEAVADSLADVYDKAIKAFGQITVVKPGITAALYESRGKIPCPFRDGTFEKGEVIVKDLRSGGKLVVTSLSIHLIREHCFFQGRGSRFRIDPADTVKMFGLGLSG
jgi:hypothetical protein